jgi:hypothetical protein
MVGPYFFDNQIRQYLLQFASIFYGLQIQTGIGECDVAEMITVPCVLGHRDRVVAAINAGNTQNRVFSIPAMSFHMTALNIAPERRRVQAYVDQRVTLPVGGIFPNDLTVVKRVMPVPYTMEVELAIYTSNMQQRDQILEQILVLFNPDLQIQKSDGPFDWTKLTNVELLGINNEENYPASTDRRIIQWTLNFSMPIYLSIPMGVKDDLVRKIIVQISDMSTMVIGEVDENGEVTYGDPLALMVFDTTVDPSDPNYFFPPSEGPIPPEPEPLP